MKSQIIAAKQVYGIGPFIALVIALFPLVAVSFFCLFLLLPSTRDATLSLLSVDGSVDLLTAAILFVGGIWGFRLAWQIKKHQGGLFGLLFYLAFGLGLIFMCMEEIAWGQQFFPSATASGLSEIKQQVKTPLRSLSFLKNHFEIFPVMFGIISLLGLWLSKKGYFREVSPPYILLPWFLVIGLVSLVDLSHDIYVFSPKLDDLINDLEEGVELLLSISGGLFIWLNAKKLIS